MGKLSKAKKMTDVERYCIQGMYWNNMEASDISKALGRDLEEVTKYVAKLERENDSSIIHETGGGNKGVAVMTQAGSQRVDAARQITIPPHNNANTIHSIHD
jgi:hypothetical protein